MRKNYQHVPWSSNNRRTTLFGKERQSLGLTGIHSEADRRGEELAGVYALSVGPHAASRPRRGLQSDNII